MGVPAKTVSSDIRTLAKQIYIEIKDGTGQSFKANRKSSSQIQTRSSSSRESIDTAVVIMMINSKLKVNSGVRKSGG